MSDLLSMDPTLQKIEKIKVKIYNKIKNMTSEEVIDYFNNNALKAAEKYGFTVNFVKNKRIKPSVDAGTKE